MESRPINSRDDFPIGDPANKDSDTGPHSNNYVRKLMEEKLAEYEKQLWAMKRQGKTNAQTNDSLESDVKGFLKLKIENLRAMLNRTDDLKNDSKNS